VSTEHFQWWDLIRAAALLPYVFIGPALIKLYRRGGMPSYCAAALLVSFVATVLVMPAYMLFDAPDWLGWAWMATCLGAGFGALGISWRRNRLVMLRTSGLTDDEHALLAAGQRAAQRGSWFDVEAGLDDLRRRAQHPIRPSAPDGPAPSAASPDEQPASHRVRNAAPGRRTDFDRPAGRGRPPRRG
jgi:hypothetical protein